MPGAPPSCYAMDRDEVGRWLVDRNLHHKAPTNTRVPTDVVKEIKQKEPLETPDAFPRVFHTTFEAWK